MATAWVRGYFRAGARAEELPRTGLRCVVGVVPMTVK